ncbi:hypothetical protein JXA84_01110 [candidate division WOR-3 bacterium]|nr:hypothetical protein [candidate division WOR-3 bacterium]
MGVFFWTKIIKLLGASIVLKKALKIWFISSLGRYLPGKAWHLLGMMFLLSKEGIPVEVAITSSFFVQVYSLIPGIIISAFSIMPFLGESRLILSIPLISFGILIVLFISHPRIIGKLIQFLAKKRGKSIIAPGISPINSFLILLSYLIYWVLRGFGFFLFIKSFYFDIGVRSLPLAVSVFSSSYIIGLLFLLSPGGVGIRESVMLKMTNSLLKIPTGIASGLTIFNRIWLTFIEFICLLMALAINWRGNAKHEKKRKKENYQ